MLPYSTIDLKQMIKNDSIHQQMIKNNNGQLTIIVKNTSQ